MSEVGPTSPSVAQHDRPPVVVRSLGELDGSGALEGRGGAEGSEGSRAAASSSPRRTLPPARSCTGGDHSCFPLFGGISVAMEMASELRVALQAPHRAGTQAGAGLTAAPRPARPHTSARPSPTPAPSGALLSPALLPGLLLFLLSVELCRSGAQRDSWACTVPLSAGESGESLSRSWGLWVSPTPRPRHRPEPGPVTGVGRCGAEPLRRLSRSHRAVGGGPGEDAL